MTETLMHHAAAVESAGRVHPPQGRKNSSVVKRSVVRNGHKSSISLEDEFWDALREIADHEHIAISALVATIDHGRTTNNLSSAIRVFVLDHFRRSDKPKPAASARSCASRIACDEGLGRPPRTFCGVLCIRGRGHSGRAAMELGPTRSPDLT